MHRPFIRALAVFFSMIAAFGVANYLEALEKIPASAGSIDLESMIPKELDGWMVDNSLVPVLPSPDLQAVVDSTYDRVLSRTYIGANQQRVMLLIAYAGNFAGRPIQYHRPEICYPAQGFELLAGSRGTVATQYGQLSVERLSTKNGFRHEPITFWITVSRQRASYGLSLRWIQLKSSLTGQVPDGMLVRLSSIDPDTESAYRIHDEFIGELLSAMKPGDIPRIAELLDDRK